MASLFVWRNSYLLNSSTLHGLCYNLHMTTAGFEYKKKKTETPFETFLRYTDEKEKSVIVLATILQKSLSKTANVLDIGTGNGEYLDLALTKAGAKASDGVRLTLVEPSTDLVAQLESRFTKHFPLSHVKVVNSGLQDFKTKDSFDVILMSHLFYHLPRESWAAELSKALSMLKEGGVLIIVLRGKDDAYDFKMAFKPLLFDASFKALTIGDVLEVLPKQPALRVEKQLASSELHIPIETDLEDTVSIIEFYLNKEWRDMPAEIQQSAMKFIRDKNGTFKQVDGIALVERAG